jgi:alcohol dehydrogenase class IV
MAVATLKAGWVSRDMPELHVGSGVLADVGAAVAALGIRLPLVVSDPGVAAAGWPSRVLTALRQAGLRPAVWAGSRSDPDIPVVQRCRAVMASGGHDGLVAVGGGSVIDVAKACSGLMAHPGQLIDYEGLGRFSTPGVPIVAVLSTPGSGAELTQHAVIADHTGRKFAVSGRWLTPRLVLADPDTLATLPQAVAVDTVLDAMLHAIEAYLAPAATPYSDVWARVAIATLVGAAVPAVRYGDPAASADLITGCLAAGLAVANTNAGVVHALGYPLTSEYRVPHGRANALMAPTALRAVAPAAPDRYAELGRLLVPAAPAPDAGAAFAELRSRLGVTASLADYGVTYAALPRLARLATGYGPVLANTPRSFTEAELCELYRSAWYERTGGS